MPRPVLLIRADRNEEDAATLAKLGISSVIDPYLRIALSSAVEEARAMQAALTRASANDKSPTWLVLTSTNGIKYFEHLIGRDNLLVTLANPSLKFAAVGNATKDALLELGVPSVLTPEIFDSAHLAEALIATGQGVAVWPRSAIALNTFPTALTNAGWNLIDGVVYETKPIDVEPSTAKAAAAGEFSAIVVLSPSAGLALATYVDPKFSNLANTDIVGIGETTTQALINLGFQVAKTATTVRGAFE